MGDRPDDVLGPEGGIAAEEHVWKRRLHCDLIDDRHTPAIELETEITLDPGKGILLPNGDQDIIVTISRPYLQVSIID